jgi:YesN/AraC family two-component response regulator
MTQKRKPRVLLADDELHIRALMKAVIKSINGEIVAEATNGQDAVRSFQ